MIDCPIPENEHRRLAALRSLQILDSPPELRFNLIVNHVAREFKVPIALITLIDSNRQWFKAAHGVDISEIPRNISVCAHAICEINSTVPAERIYEVYDLAKDLRFHDSPLVTDEPNARSYISFVLQSVSGENIGSLCLVDFQARKYSHSEQDMLAGIGNLVDNLINGSSTVQH